MEQSPTNNPTSHIPHPTSQLGQVLAEILIAVAVGGALILAAATLMAVVLRVSAANKYLQAASYLSQELLDEVAVFAEAKWYCPTTSGNCKDLSNNSANYGIYNIPNKGSDYHFRLKKAGSPPQYILPFQWDAGEEDDSSINIDGVQYTRYFYAENVCRRLDNGNISSVFGQGGISCVLGSSEEDPSTQKVTAVTSWPQGGEVRISKFLTRTGNRVFVQTDWSGGPTYDPPVVVIKPDNKFHVAEVIKFDDVGEIKISTDELPGG